LIARPTIYDVPPADYAYYSCPFTVTGIEVWGGLKLKPLRESLFICMPKFIHFVACAAIRYPGVPSI